MKKWQKIIGIIAFAIIIIYELLIWVNAYVDMKYIVEPIGNNMLEDCMYTRIGSLSFGMFLNFALALFLFICLWRKGGKKCLASLIHSGLMQKQSVHHFKYGDIYAFNETTDVRLQCMFILPIMTSMIFQGHLPMCQKHRH